MSPRPGSSARSALSSWAWPVVAIVAIAIAGQIFGLLGAIISAAVGCFTILSVGAELADDASPAGRRRLRRGRLLLPFGAVLLVVLLFAAQGAIPWLVPHPSSAASQGEGPVDLRGKRVTQAEADRSDLRGAQLAGADLSRLDLRRRPLDGASAPGAVFRGANLAGATLQRADLRGADLTGACLDGADLAGADRGGARAADVPGDCPGTG